MSGHLVTPTTTTDTDALYSLLLDLSMKLVPYWFLAIYHYTLGAPARLFFALVHSRRPLFGPGDGPGDGPGGLEDGPGEGPGGPAVLVGDNRALLLEDNGQAEAEQQQQEEEEIVEVEFSYEELEALLLVIIWTQVLRLDAYYHPISANGLVHPVVATSLAIITKYFNILSFFIFWRVILEQPEKNGQKVGAKNWFYSIRKKGWQSRLLLLLLFDEMASPLTIGEAVRTVNRHRQEHGLFARSTLEMLFCCFLLIGTRCMKVWLWLVVPLLVLFVEFPLMFERLEQLLYEFRHC
ncbi:hypothetical protein TYRP_022225 [Tyrophagus putrescentiae]|nr:hypothetical protein TYRP_022225 [Tyrophagus putrescentiae]